MFSARHKQIGRIGPRDPVEARYITSLFDATSISNRNHISPTPISPLSKQTTVAEMRTENKMCQEADLNRRHEDFQSSALPTELSRLEASTCNPARAGERTERVHFSKRVYQNHRTENLCQLKNFRGGHKNTHAAPETFKCWSGRSPGKKFFGT
jgi:hypothetical protein